MQQQDFEFIEQVDINSQSRSDVEGDGGHVNEDNLIDIAIPVESWKEMLNPSGDKFNKQWTTLMVDCIKEHITPSCVLSFTSASLRPQKSRKKGHYIHAGIRKVQIPIMRTLLHVGQGRAGRR